MDKQEFLVRLERGLAGLPREDVEERLCFYSEMIDDRMEDGLSEAEAVEEIGPVDEIVSQIIAETPLTKLVKEKIRPRGKTNAWIIVLLVLGFPLWFPLLAAAFAVMLSLYIVLWALVLSLWAIFVSLVVCALAGPAAGLVNAFKGEVLTGLALIGAGLTCAGLAIFLFFGCVAATKGVARLTGKMLLALKMSFINKEDA